jgi:hypothetical protein
MGAKNCTQVGGEAGNRRSRLGYNSRGRKRKLGLSRKRAQETQDSGQAYRQETGAVGVAQTRLDTLTGPMARGAGK